MKVYELMAQLSECAAGAEVEFHTIVGVSELTSFDHIEGDCYCYNSAIKETELDNTEQRVYLYG